MNALNSREEAFLIWGGVVVIWSCVSKASRPLALSVLRALFHRKIISVVGISLGYAVGCVWLLAEAHIWTWDNLKTTVVWWMTFAIVSQFDTKGLEEGPKTLSRLAAESLSIGALVVFIGEFYTFPLWGELLLLPVLFVLAAMLALAEHRMEHAIVVKPLTVIQVSVVLGIFGYSAYQIAKDLRDFATLQTAREFAVPIALSLMFLPFLYCVSLYMAYEMAAIQLSFAIEDRILRRYAFWQGLFAFGGRVDTVRRYVRDVRIAGVRERGDIRRVISELRCALSRERQRPNIDWECGWSPYDAREFLADQQLLTDDYHRSFDDSWVADSPPIKIGEFPLEARLSYSIYGTESGATQLELEVSEYKGGDMNHSDSRFYDTASLLVLRALGDETARRFVQLIAGCDEGTMTAGVYTIVLSRDDWGANKWSGISRRVTLTHRAHRDPLAQVGSSNREE